MAFDILSFAIGKAAGGGGGSTKKIIFSEQTLGFSYSEGYGAYVHAITDSIPFTLVDGKEYNIVWDGKKFARTAFAYTNPADGSNCVAVGNTLVTGGENNGDIFAVVCDITNGFTYFFSLETTASHTVEIYQGEEQFTGVETSVALDFSGGDMEVTPNEGEAFSKVTIPQPDTLVAGNIAEGVTVAGILGTLSGGGGGSENYSIVTGSFTATGKQMTVSHDWGKIPDMLIVVSSSQNNPASQGYSMLLLTFGFKQSLIDALGGKLECLACSGWYNGLMSTSAYNEGIDLEEYTSFYVNYGGVRNVTPTSFTVGYDGETNNMGSLKPDGYYSYYAVFGLT